MTHGDDFVLTGPTERLTEFVNEMTGVYPINAKVISYGSTESIKPKSWLALTFDAVVVSVAAQLVSLSV